MLTLTLSVFFGIIKIFSSDSHIGKKKNSKLIIDPVTGNILTKGPSRVDKYGIELNKYIIDGVYNQGIDKITIKEIEDWSLHIPHCPHLRPIKHSKKVINPKCETSSLQFVNLSKNASYPYVLPLHDISELSKKFNNWKSEKLSDPNYEEQNISELLDENYHPYDYGFDEVSHIDNKMVNPKLKKKFKPQNRRLFSFISFDFQFDLLDIYLAENYDIVDYFVIFESNTTVIGQPKPLYFTRTLLESKRYKHFKNKLIPLPYIMPKNKDGSMEDHIMNLMIEKGLRAVNARHGDLFVYGTVGEIPKHHVLSRLKNCGGWEHLYSGIGGFSSNDKSQKVKPLAFSSWSYQYSIENVEDNEVGTSIHPNLAIFDIRHNIKNIDDSSEFDPYIGYIDFNTSRNTTLNTSKSALLWSAGWDMSRFYPTVDHIYNKLTSISSEYKNKDEDITKYDIKTKIGSNKNIFDNQKKSYVKNKMHKTPPINGFTYNFEYKHWKEQMVKPDNNFTNEIEILLHEIPHQLGRNSLCYNYMFERQFGINATLWYEAIPRKEWESIDLNKIDYNTVGKFISPWTCPGELEDLKIMSSEETVLDIINNRKSITRFGDGEYSMIINNHWQSTFQQDNNELASKLREIIFSNEEKLLIGVPENLKHEFLIIRHYQDFWTSFKNDFEYKLVDFHSMNKLYGSSMMSRFYVPMINKSGVPDYIKLLKRIWEDRDVLIIEGELTRFGVGNDFLDNAKSIKRILGPAKDAYSAYDKILAEALKQPRSSLVILSLGQTATVLAYDLYKAGFQAVDMGHADIEYEWYLKKSNNKRIKIEGKFVNEAGEAGRTNIADIHDEKYESEIIIKINNDTISDN